MTVCIAARYEDEQANDGLVMVADWLLTDNKTGKASETGFKLSALTPDIWAMGSGDMEMFADLCGRARRKLAAPELLPEHITVEDAKNSYLWAESQYRQEYLQRHVLYRFQGIQEALTDKSATSVQNSFLKTAEEATRDIKVPFSVDVIIAGFNPEGGSSIYKITDEDAGEEVGSGRGYAVIGEGWIVAKDEMDLQGYMPGYPRSYVAFMCYLAKKRSQIVPTVGDRTGLYVATPSDGVIMVASGVTKPFETMFKRLKKQREKNDWETTKRAAQVFNENWPRDGKEGSQHTGDDNTGNV